MRVLVVNAGSSSLKLRLLDDTEKIVASADLAADSTGFDTSALAEVLHSWPDPDVVGHRIVHGGTEFAGPVRIDDAVERRLQELTELAPLHQPKSLAGVDAVTACLPGVPRVACFDTGFHITIPPAAATYAVPADWRRKYGIRRYGFHGLSHAYASRSAADLLARSPQDLRMVTCHLGAGASLCAVVSGRSVDTTMGFTPLEGLVMATRSGTVDPGLLLWLEEHERFTPREVADALEHHSGLLALTGTSDMREVQARCLRGDPDATLGLEVYLHRLATSIGAMAVAAGGMDALVFTGGVGEHSPTIRQRVADRLAWLGVGVDAALNQAGPDIESSTATDREVTDEAATVRTLVITAREDLQVAREARNLLGW